MVLLAQLSENLRRRRRSEKELIRYLTLSEARSELGSPRFTSARFACSHFSDLQPPSFLGSSQYLRALITIVTYLSIFSGLIGANEARKDALFSQLQTCRELLPLVVEVCWRVSADGLSMQPEG